MTKTVHPFDELLASARVQPDDAPGTAAALLWGRLAEEFDVPRDSTVSPLGVVDRVVLVLLDVAGLPSREVAVSLHTDVSTVHASHEAARARIGLPPTSSPRCDGWAVALASHRYGDPAAIDDIVAHVGSCLTCSESTAVSGRGRSPRRRRPRGRRAGALAAPALAAFAPVVPLAAATVAVAAAVTAASIAILPANDNAAGVEPIPVPVVVDDAPGLPSDSGPSGGVLQPGDSGLEDGLPASELDGDAPTTVAPVDPATSGPTDALDDVAEDTSDTVEDLVQDTTGTVEDLVDDTISELPAVPDAPDVPVDDTVLDDTTAGDSFSRLRDSLLP